MLRAIVLSVAAALAGCQPPARGSVAPDGSRAEDARTLPAFGDGDEGSDGEVERFAVEIGDAPTRGPSDAAITIALTHQRSLTASGRRHSATAATDALPTTATTPRARIHRRPT